MGMVLTGGGDGACRQPFAVRDIVQPVANRAAAS
jgi:hypothetical protein